MKRDRVANDLKKTIKRGQASEVRTRMIERVKHTIYWKIVQTDASDKLKDGDIIRGIFCKCETEVKKEIDVILVSNIMKLLNGGLG